ncbi:phage shock protein PspA [Pleionea mediterranea]|uniref:Phage shock protein A (PspA) family protein n=1 Tax=Pleionea mediterranea TaxID=523701 RepID=A0A316G0U3_9GAMM|nr:phage shock protein PspA [Pleionea mediterranea]PWK47967.1 phage shock protein A (PspA) family protein [Pleionea mediterranea]
MGVFGRLSDIINSNINSLLDKAEDPEKLVRLIIQEMEQTLIEVRSASARTIADKKELSRKMASIEKDIACWQEKAELAVSKERDDLATAALQEKNRLEQVFNVQKQEMKELEGALEKLEFDVSRLQSKLNEAVARRDTMLLRQQTLCQQKQVKQQVNRPNLNSAFEKFEMFERKIDQMEAEVEAMSLGQNVSLKHQIDDLVVSEHIENELKALKQKVAKQ